MLAALAVGVVGEHDGVRPGSPQDGQRDSAVGAVGQRGLPLDEHHVPVAEGPDHLLDDAGREVGRNPVDDHATVGAHHDTRLPRCDLRGVQPPIARRRVEFERRRPLADGAVGPHHEDHVGVDVEFAVRDLEVRLCRRLADVDDPDLVLVGQ